MPSSYSALYLQKRRSPSRPTLPPPPEPRRGFPSPPVPPSPSPPCASPDSRGRATSRSPTKTTNSSTNKPTSHKHDSSRRPAAYGRGGTAPPPPPRQAAPATPRSLPSQATFLSSPGAAAVTRRHSPARRSVTPPRARGAPPPPASSVLRASTGSLGSFLAAAAGPGTSTNTSQRSLVARLIAESAKRQTGRPPPQPPPSLPLSVLLRKSLPQVFDGKRLSAVGRGVTGVDRLPDAVASRVLHLFLSDNSLAAPLDGLRQFTAVRCLSLANNLIRRLEDLKPLESLPRLESLLLEGNPVRREACYRLYVVGSLSPSLIMLDKAPVTSQEREDGPAAVRRVRAFEEHGIRSTCRIVQLQHLAKVLRLHQEFREVVYGRRGPAPPGSVSTLLRGGDGCPSPAQALKRLLALWPLEAWTRAYPHLHQVMADKLRLDSRKEMEAAYRLAHQQQQQGKQAAVGEVWEAAFGRVVLWQQEAVDALGQECQALIHATQARCRETVLDGHQDQHHALTPSSTGARPPHAMAGGGGGVSSRDGSAGGRASCSPPPFPRAFSPPRPSPAPHHSSSATQRRPPAAAPPPGAPRGGGHAEPSSLSEAAALGLVPDREQVHRKYTSLLRAKRNTTTTTTRTARHQQHGTGTGNYSMLRGSVEGSVVSSLGWLGHHDGGHDGGASPSFMARLLNESSVTHIDDDDDDDEEAERQQLQARAAAAARAGGGGAGGGAVGSVRRAVAPSSSSAPRSPPPASRRPAATARHGPGAAPCPPPSPPPVPGSHRHVRLQPPEPPEPPRAPPDMRSPSASRAGKEGDLLHRLQRGAALTAHSPAAAAAQHRPGPGGAGGEGGDADSEAGGSSSRRSLVGSLPPQQQEPAIDEEAEEDESAYQVVLRLPREQGQEEGAAAFSLAEEEARYKSAMSLRVGAMVRQAPGRTVRALGQQVAQLQGPDMAQRLQAEMALYRLNKHLRKLLEAGHRRRLSAMEAADGYVSVAEAELARLQERVEALRCKVAELEASRKEAAALEQEAAQVFREAVLLEEEGHRLGFLKLQAMDEHEAARQRLDQARHALDKARQEAAADVSVARAERTVRSLARADDFRRQRLHFSQHVAGMRPLIQVFQQFCTRLRYRLHLRHAAQRHLARLTLLRIRLGLRRWWRRSRGVRGRALLARRCQTRTRGWAWQHWRRRLWVERAIRAFREHGPMRRAHWGLARWAGRAREGRHRRAVCVWLQSRRRLKRCWRAWLAHTSSWTYRDRSERSRAEEAARRLWTRFVFRRWSSSSRQWAAARAGKAVLVEQRTREGELRAALRRWRRETSVLKRRRRSLTGHFLWTWRRSTQMRSAVVSVWRQVLERKRGRWAREALQRWKDYSRWATRRDVWVPALVLGYRRRRLRQALRQWRLALWADVRREREWSRRAALDHTRLLREVWSCWRAEASSRAGLRRAIVALEALLTRRRLKRVQARWRLQVKRCREEDERDRRRADRAKVLARRRWRARRRSCFLAWKALARHRARLRQAAAAVARAQRKKLQQRAMWWWAWARAARCLDDHRAFSEGRSSLHLAHLSASQRVEEEASQLDEVEAEKRRLEVALAGVQACLVEKQVELMERSAASRSQADLTDHLSFKAHLLEEEISFLRQQEQQSGAGTEQEGALVVAEGPGIAGGEPLGTALVRQAGGGPDEEELERILADMQQQQELMSERLSEAREAEARLLQEVEEYEAGRPREAEIQACIAEARKYRFDLEERVAKAEALGRERDELQRRLQACASSLERAEAQLSWEVAESEAELQAMTREAHKLRADVELSSKAYQLAHDLMRVRGRELLELSGEARLSALQQGGGEDGAADDALLDIALTTARQHYTATGGPGSRKRERPELGSEDEEGGRPLGLPSQLPGALTNLNFHPELDEEVAAEGLVDAFLLEDQDHQHQPGPRPANASPPGLASQVAGYVTEESLGQAGDQCREAHRALRDSAHRLVSQRRTIALQQQQHHWTDHTDSEGRRSHREYDRERFRDEDIVPTSPLEVSTGLSQEDLHALRSVQEEIEALDRKIRMRFQEGGVYEVAGEGGGAAEPSPTSML